VNDAMDRLLWHEIMFKTRDRIALTVRVVDCLLKLLHKRLHVIKLYPRSVQELNKGCLRQASIGCRGGRSIKLFLKLQYVTDHFVEIGEQKRVH
jgi:hypothetical protein